MGSTKLEQQVLEVIQQGFPIASHPYEELGRTIGATEDEAFDAVQALCEKGIIRRLGGSFDSRKIGYKSTLVALSAPADRLEDVVALVNEYPEVTHNYEREGAYNVWFTIIAPSEDEIERIIDEIQAKTGSPALNLPASHMFKIKVDFDLGEDDT